MSVRPAIISEWLRNEVINALKQSGTAEGLSDAELANASDHGLILQLVGELNDRTKPVAKPVTTGWRAFDRLS